MARPYSVDLRERVVRSVEREGLSRRAAAKRYGVGIKTAIIWVQRFRTTGSVAASRMGGHRPRKIIGRHREWLLKRCQGSDLTLRGLVAELAQRGLQVRYRPVWAFIHPNDGGVSWQGIEMWRGVVDWSALWDGETM